jgi:hypothetical protein
MMMNGAENFFFFSFAARHVLIFALLVLSPTKYVICVLVDFLPLASEMKECNSRDFFVRREMKFSLDDFDFFREKRE